MLPSVFAVVAILTHEGKQLPEAIDARAWVQTGRQCWTVTTREGGGVA